MVPEEKKNASSVNLSHEQIKILKIMSEVFSDLLSELKWLNQMSRPKMIK